MEWGETYVEEALDVRGWLLKEDSNKEKDDQVCYSMQRRTKEKINIFDFWMLEL